MSKRINKQIIAIGGGGFSKFGDYTPSHLLIEKYFIDQTHKKSPRICFIPTASGESMKYIADFHQAFSHLDCKTSHLSLFDLPTHDLESFVLDQDAIYVGGGNTKSMLALWKEWKLDRYLQKAWEEGIVLGGISAGALCWFEEGVTDSIPGKLTRLKCLGMLSGSHCPHYDSNKQRRPSYHNLIKQGMVGGIAADDHVALHYINNKLEKIVRATNSGHAFYVKLLSGKIVEKKITPSDLLLSKENQ